MAPEEEIVPDSAEDADADVGATGNAVACSSSASIDIEDFRCSICLAIMTEPVQPPCKHNFCLECFEDSLQKASGNCPICRRRLTGWHRDRLSKHKSVIHQEKWQFMQENKELLQRLESEAEAAVARHIGSPHAEFDEDRYRRQMQQLDQQLKEERKRREEALSKPLLEKLKRSAAVWDPDAVEYSIDDFNSHPDTQASTHQTTAAEGAAGGQNHSVEYEPSQKPRHDTTRPTRNGSRPPSVILINDGASTSTFEQLCEAEAFMGLRQAKTEPETAGPADTTAGQTESAKKAPGVSAVEKPQVSAVPDYEMETVDPALLVIKAKSTKTAAVAQKKQAVQKKAAKPDVPAPSTCPNPTSASPDVLPFNTQATGLESVPPDGDLMFDGSQPAADDDVSFRLADDAAADEMMEDAAGQELAGPSGFAEPTTEATNYGIAHQASTSSIADDYVNRFEPIMKAPVTPNKEQLALNRPIAVTAAPAATAVRKITFDDQPSSSTAAAAPATSKWCPSEKSGEDGAVDDDRELEMTETVELLPEKTVNAAARPKPQHPDWSPRKYRMKIKSKHQQKQHEPRVKARDDFVVAENTTADAEPRIEDRHAHDLFRTTVIGDEQESVEKETQPPAAANAAECAPSTSTAGLTTKNTVSNGRKRTRPGAAVMKTAGKSTALQGTSPVSERRILLAKRRLSKPYATESTNEKAIDEESRPVECSTVAPPDIANVEKATKSSGKTKPQRKRPTKRTEVKQKLSTRRQLRSAVGTDEGGIEQTDIPMTAVVDQPAKLPKSKKQKSAKVSRESSVASSTAASDVSVASRAKRSKSGPKTEAELQLERDMKLARQLQTEERLGLFPDREYEKRQRRRSKALFS